MRRLCGDDAARIKLRYDGGMIKCDKDLLLLMMGGGYLRDEDNSSKKIFIGNKQICENPNTLQLGWNTVIIAEFTEGNFTLGKVAVLIDGVEFAIDKIDGYSQIVTRSVGSCTFVCIKQANKYIIAHLDVDYLNQALRLIIEKLGGANGEVCFCSCVDDNDETQFKDALAQHVNVMHHFSRSKAPSSRSKAPCCLNHMEIGISAETDGTVKLFGDMVRFSIPTYEAPCRLIEENFDNINLARINRQKQDILDMG